MKVLSRRAMLKGAGGIAVALPMLEAMYRPRAARAAATAQRFVVFFSANGTIMDSWQPPGAGNTFPLAAMSDILGPLQAHRDQLLVMRGLNDEISYKSPGSNPHDLAMGTMLTGSTLRVGPSGLGRAGHVVDGTVNGRSIDQAIAAGIGGTTKFSSLSLGVQSTSTILEPMVLRMSYRGPSDPVTPEDDPAKAFAALFGDTVGTQAQVLAQQKRRGTVLDAVRKDYTRLMTRLGAEDRGRLDRHVTSIRELEKQLVAPVDASKSCRGVMPTAPTVSLTPRDCIQDGRPGRCVGDFPAIGKAQMDILALALACDLTRVATLQWSTAESTVVHSWLGITGEHHLLSHDLATAPDLAKINRWYAQQFAYLLDKLTAIKEPDGTTLLDSSVVFWPNELSIGWTHDRRDLPYLIAGKGGGTLRPGRFVRYNGEPHNRLYSAFMNMFGLPNTGFGDAEFGGTLSGLA
jgi:hypothetical protein